MNKKTVLIFLIAGVILSIAAYMFFVGSQNTELSPEEINLADSIEPIQETLSEPKIINPIENLKPEELNLDDITSCEILKSTYSTEMEFIDTAIKDLFIDGSGHSNAGGYSTMSAEEFDALVNAKDASALALKGSRTHLEGIQGMSMQELNKLYNSDKEKYSEFVTNFKIDFEKISEGEEYLYQAGLRGKVGAIWEMLLQKNVLVRQMIWRELPSEDVYAQVIEKKALLSVWKKLNTNNPEVLSMFNTDVMNQSLDEVLGEYNKQYGLAVNDEDLSESSDEIAKRFITKWETDRSYIGEDAYLRFIPEDYAQYAQKALELSCWSSNN